MKKANLMIVGTSSGAGKSLFVTALCRIFYKDKYKVSPFKSQNMALNSYITKDGYNFGKYSYTIGRAYPLEYCNGSTLKNNRYWSYVWDLCLLFIFLTTLEFIFRSYRRKKI